MSAPKFLTFEQVEILHARAIAEFGGILGIRDRGQLESAIFHPQNFYFYGQVDLFEIAAAYAYHIAEAQAFLDGNKRAAIAAALVFLELNGVTTKTNTETFYDAMIAIAEKRMDRAGLAAVLRVS